MRKLMDLFFLPKDRLVLLPEDLTVTLNYHKRINRFAEPEVESYAGEVQVARFVSPAIVKSRRVFIGTGNGIFEVTRRTYDSKSKKSEPEARTREANARSY